MKDIFVAITVDYETWHPTVAGYEKRWQENNIVIDWEKDVISSTYALLDVADEVGVKLTLMAEMCEYIWLKENDNPMAQKIAEQLQNAVVRGHDVQLHIHPHWMPETGASYVDGKWIWNCEYAKAENYPSDLYEMIKMCKEELERIIVPVKRDYKVTCFRAGSYLVQPFTRLYDALAKNSIFCDSSVYMGGISADRGYDFSGCKHKNQPYMADRDNPAVEDVLNSNMIELPIYTWKQGKRWKFDNGELFAYEFILGAKDTYIEDENYFVMIGHSKEQQDYEILKKQFLYMKKTFQVEWLGLSDLENRSRKYLEIEEKKQRKPMTLSFHILIRARVEFWLNRLKSIYNRKIKRI